MALRCGPALASITLAVALSACGGGGGARTALPVLPPNAPAQGAAKSVTVAFRIVVGAANSSARRSPRYVSASTQSASITVAASGGSASSPVVVNCTNTCSGQIAAPLGSDTFTAKLFDQTNAAGNLLSTGTLTQTIAIDQANAVSMTFNGVVHALAVALNPSAVTPGTPATVLVNFAALDADGDAIVGPGSYVDSNGNALTVTLSSSDASDARLSASTFTAPPSTPPTLSYDGASTGNITVAASASSGASANATLAVGCGSAVYVSNDGYPATSTISSFVTTANGDAAPSHTIQVTGVPYGLAIDPSANLYATIRTFPGWNVSAFAPCASGAATPIRSFTDSAYQSAIPQGLGVNRSGSVAIALANELPPPPDTIDVFGPSAAGAVSPAQSITGAATGLDYPTGAAIDNAGDVFAANSDGNTVTAYAPGATGNVAPAQTLTADLTRALNSPNAVAWSATGMLYVANAGAKNANNPLSGEGGPGGVDSVIVYAADATGYPAPLQIIEGAATQLDSPSDVTVDAAGTIYVLNTGAAPTITVYAAGANGNVAPARVLAGSNVFPAGTFATSIAVDAALNLYVPEGPNGIAIFAPTANGNAVPSATLSGSNVGYVDRVRVGATGTIYVTSSGQPAAPIEVFAAGSSGNPTPAATIDLPPVSLEDISPDAAGDLWVAEGTGYSVPDNPLTVPQIVELPPGANGNASPARTLVVPNALGPIASGVGGIAVVNFGLPFEVDVFASTASGTAAPLDTVRGTTNGPYVPQNVGLDASGNLYVACLGDGTVKVFAPGANGTATPIRVLEGLPAFSTAEVDAAGNVYVAVDDVGTSRVGEILVFAAGTNGAASPSRIISGGATGITFPIGVIAGP